MKSVLVKASIVMAFLCAIAFGDIWYVHPDSALNSIQAALDSCSFGDTVLVAPGVYYENIVWPNLHGIHLTSESGPDSTIIDGTGTESVIIMNADALPSHTTIIDGFTIRNGVAGNGGGINCETVHLSIHNTIITGNRAITGGGIYCKKVQLILTDVILHDNTADCWDGPKGGGIYCENSSAYLTNVTIDSNTGSSFNGTDCGGGIYLDDSHPILDGVIISNNYATIAGGMYAHESNPILIDVTINKNKNIGVYCYKSNPSLTNVTISDNTGWYGGGFTCYESNPYLTNVVISGNSASRGGGMYCQSNSQPVLKNVTITENAGEHGGGIYCSNSNLSFDTSERCNIYFNYAGSGNELYAIDCAVMSIAVDTFTVLQPDDYFAYPRSGFTFDVLHGKVEQTSQDLYVSDSGSNSNSGLTPAEPLQTIFYAFAKILPDSLHHLTVHLASGTYAPSQTGETFPINCRDYVSLQGDDEMLTVLDGEGRDILYCDHDSTFSVQTMTIQHGGTGVKCVSCNPHISNVTISENLHGIECSLSDPVVTNVTISDNTGMGISLDHSGPVLLAITVSNNGWGGIDCYYSNPMVNNATITGNNSSSIGGGLNCFYSSPTLTNVVINGNTANEGGGICCIEAHPSLTDVIISENTAAEYGGGMSVRNNSNPNMRGVTICGNSARWGGGMRLSSCPNFDSTDRCNVYLNHATAGHDLFSWNTSVDVIVDTFTVLNPTSYHACPLELFTFDILHAAQEQVDADLYVSPDGDNTNSGLSWGDPLQTIGYAHSMIMADSLDPHTIHLAPGTYSPNTNGEGFPITPVSFVSLQGSGESETVLDADSSNHVMFFMDVHNMAVHGLTITGGSADEGAGIYCISSSPTLSNMTITNNTASGTWAYGGGMSCVQSSPTLTNVTIDNNKTLASGTYASGGGIFSRYNSALSLTDVFISNNITSGEEATGGGICSYDASLILNNAAITGNSAVGSNWSAGGGIYFRHNVHQTLETDRMPTDITGDTHEWLRTSWVLNKDDNILNEQIERKTVPLDSDLVLTEVTVSENGALYGGGMSCSYCSSRLTNVTIQGNSQGGISSSYADMNLINVLITDNSTSGYGGAISCYRTDAELTNAAISGNTALHGGALYCQYSDAVLVDCIFWNDAPQEVYFYDSGEPSSITVSYSDVQGGEEGIETNDNGTVYWLDGNLDADPLFSGSGEHPYSLQEASPCIEAGTPDTAGLNLPAWDIIGNVRVWDSDSDGTAIIDMGAYEFGAPPVGIDELSPITPVVYSLSQNYPNPFRKFTTIDYSVPERTKVQLTIYDVSGRRVRCLINSIHEPGSYSIQWNSADDFGRRIAAGIYFMKITVCPVGKTEGFSETKKLLLIR